MTNAKSRERLLFVLFLPVTGGGGWGGSLLLSFRVSLDSHIFAINKLPVYAVDGE